MAAARKPKLVAELPPDLPAQVERAVRAAGALPVAKLHKLKLAEAAQRELDAAMAAAGLERAGKVVRVPLGEQIAALVKGGARVSLKDVPKRVKGGAKKELDAAIDRMLKAGEARIVVRTAVEVLVGTGDRALDAAEVTALVKAHAALGKVLKKVIAKGRARSILRDDLAEMVEPAVRASRHADAKAKDVEALVAAALERREDAALGLVRVPDVVRDLDGQAKLAEIHRALMAAADAGAIELRPEAGGEFLSEADAKLCPPGPRGTVLSYARRVRP
jgi:hypothetical protein